MQNNYFVILNFFLKKKNFFLFGPLGKKILFFCQNFFPKSCSESKNKDFPIKSEKKKFRLTEFALMYAVLKVHFCLATNLLPKLVGKSSFCATLVEKKFQKKFCQNFFPKLFRTVKKLIFQQVWEIVFFAKFLAPGPYALKWFFRISQMEKFSFKPRYIFDVEIFNVIRTYAPRIDLLVSPDTVWKDELDLIGGSSATEIRSRHESYLSFLGDVRFIYNKTIKSSYLHTNTTFLWVKIQNRRHGEEAS